MFFVDSHCHLNLDTFQDNVQQVVERAMEVGVNKIVVPGIDLKTSERAVELASRFPCIYAAIGVHPSKLASYEKHQENQFSNLLREQKVVAVGEIGLDFFHHPDTQSDQIRLLEIMLSLASENKKPVILHSRNALEVLLQVIQKWSAEQIESSERYRGVFHGFEGNTDQGLTAQSLQMAIGIGGPVTFKNALEKHKLVKELGIGNMVLETDSPLLSPHPFRGQPNEPAKIPVIAQRISELLEMDLEKVASITSMNAKSLFKWDESR